MTMVEKWQLEQDRLHRQMIDSLKGMAMTDQEVIREFDISISGVALYVRWIQGPTAGSGSIHSVIAKDGTQDLSPLFEVSKWKVLVTRMEAEAERAGA
jgi:hypothetical protein